MGTVILIACVTSLLVLWDVLLKTLSATHRGLARFYLRTRISHMAARLMRLARVYGGLRVELDPRLVSLPPNPCLICSNHQSMADIAILLAAFKSHDIRFVAKHELTRGFPAVSEVLRIQRHALINRTGGYRATARALARLGRRARNGSSPVVFPEGTRSRAGDVRQFHTGGIRTILEVTQLPIVGVAIDGGYRFASMQTLIRGLRGITYRVGYVGVFDPGTSKQSIQSAVEQVRSAVVKQIDGWHRIDQSRGVPGVTT
jgi:1-acyl-sn-glycerol-3-phosphate acyltransferase